MQIILVRPTDTSYHLNQALDCDFWELVDNRDEYDVYTTFKRLDSFFCNYEVFNSFTRAEEYLESMDTTDSYKEQMQSELDKLKIKFNDDVEVFSQC